MSTPQKMLATLGIHLLLVAAVCLTIFPLAWMAMASVMPAGEASAYPMSWVPSALSLEHYRALFSRLEVVRYIMNSALIAGAVTLISLVVNSMAGYAFAKLSFPGRERVFRGLVATLVVPGQVTMLPLFMLLKYLGLINSYWGVIVPGMASVFGIFLFRQYALSIPDSLLDAARIDGAGEWRIYRSIVLPLCKPILLTLAVFTFMGTWNDFMWPLVVLTDSRLHTLPVALANLSGEHVQDTELMMAGALLTVLPVIVLYALLQRYYIEGIMVGSIKG
ncbi:MAG: carbohydrate ABC transporter permease [Pseudomonadota bacterium]|nr:carbohydrate ABC transporter permease [Gammaproteobacteria bacterium]MDQ3583489.1 carbohydrate ABC transporter permease [Pseudomonadota bacterium]